ncbi:P-loop NTPase family protein [Couchioplanes azureus]|uniref:GTPase n=1 Tax=Couchioplanes caeruleus TaxID=56438 RepID=UPI00166FE6C2|nr:GTPase [Couchioplanes caeruleus]GGQ48186.1 hypothetical protein GCM10010166_15420 [Couchioplanes caeruleus subsp. azureus]
MTEKTATATGTPDGTVSAAALGAWLARARRLTDGSALAGVADDLNAIQRHTTRPAFRVVVAGERGRGKTTLVNQLLGGDVVAADSPVPVLVVGDTTDWLEVRRDGAAETGPATAAAWASLRERPPDEGSVVRRGTPHALLTGLDVELLDTPGCNDADPDVPASVRTAVRGADATLMVLSATAALSLTETRFLREFVLAADIPLIALVLSRLDQVEADERDQVLAYVTSRAAGISPRLAVLPGPDLRDGHGAGPVASWLTANARHGDRVRLRTEQLSAQLARVMGGLADLATTAADAATLDADTRAEDVAKARLALTDELLAFDEIRVELRRRQNAAAARFRGHLAGTRERLAEILRYELYHHPEPRTWWERDLPYRLRRELATAAKEYEKSLLGGVQLDLQWLRRQLAERFRIEPSGLDVTLTSLRAPQVDPDDLKLGDLRNRRIAYRVGPLGLALLIGTLSAGFFPFASLGATAAGVVFGEVLLRGAVDNQRRVAERHLAGLVDRAVSEFGLGVAEAIRSLYDQLVDEAVQQRKQWYADREAALSAAPPADRTTRWTEIADAATRLRDEIESTLTTDGTEA